MMKKLREEGFKAGRTRLRKLIRRLDLAEKQLTAYRVTKQRKFSDSVADTLLDQNFNPTEPNQVWAGDVM